jgi:hypothetical protein
MSLVEVAATRGHEAHHVNWLGLGGETDWDLMPRIVDGDFTFVTNNASDFRRLYSRHPLHAGLIIIVPQVPPAMQRELFNAILDEFNQADEPVNEAIEVRIEDQQIIIERYALPDTHEI